MTKKKHRKTRTYITIGTALLMIIVMAFLLTQKHEPISPSTSFSQSMREEFAFKKEGEITFISSEERFLIKIDVEIADNADQRALGLMYREKLEENQGMLFIFRFDEMLSFWMKNTKLPLDMIFVNSKNTIVTIHTNTVPHSEDAYESTEPGKYVIEVNAGFVDHHGIKVGDKIRLNRF